MTESLDLTAYAVDNSRGKVQNAVRDSSDMFQALESTQRKLFPEAATLPVLLTGATNMAPLRARGVHAYGLGPPTSIEDSKRVHGNDERISLTGVRQFVEFVYHAVIGVAATNPPASSSPR